jgi:hypothetical protein
MLELGRSFEGFASMQSLDEESRRRLDSDTLKILNRSGLGGEGTGLSQLVVGQVQSGKTMSFTGLVAAARDNDFPITVVIAGTKKALFNQSVKRLRTDLKIDGDGGANPWLLIENPRTSDSVTILDALSSWQDLSVPIDFRKTTLLVALKSKAGLEKLSDLFDDLSNQIDLSRFKVLIIDDEADQASLNTKSAHNLKKNEEKASAVYAAITKLRDSLPKHAFVMYTATPQAPLLLSLQDHLSPEFVTLLTPGEDYLGGKDLFDSNDVFSQEIPLEDIQTALDPQNSDGAPQSLREAVAYFLVALTIAQERSNPKPLSMMVHPSASVDLHAKYVRWVKALLDEWKVSLSDRSESSFMYTVEKDFRPVLELMRRSIEPPERWKDFFLEPHVLQEMLYFFTRHWITQIETRVINGENKDINPTEWKQFAGWILIGGNKLERGFTVENLAVTYMPRGSGVGNADVIQQRARFFGYKRRYQDLLKAWLTQESINNYKAYVDHEIEMHRQLKILDESEASLKTWRRKFLLDKSMKICRGQVQGIPVAHEKLSFGFVLKQSQLFIPGLIENEYLVEGIKQKCGDFAVFAQDLRQTVGCRIADVNLDVALEFLADWEASPEEREQIDRVIYAVQLLSDSNLELPVKLVLMDVYQGLEQQIRSRSVSTQFESDNLAEYSRWRIKNLFQGRNPRAGDATYPGDAEIKVDDAMTIQIHKVKPESADRNFTPVFALAISLPEGTGAGIVWELD